MKTAKTNKGEFLFVGLPDGSCNFTIIESHSYMKSPRLEHSIGGIDLPPGNYQFITTTQTATEEEAKEIVDSIADKYNQAGRGKNKLQFKEYNTNTLPDCLFDTAMESLQSLTKSIGATGNCAILKVIE